MWIFSQVGFFSIVRKGDEFHVRARRKEDLVNMGLAPTKSFAVSDYPWRSILPNQTELLKVMTAFGESVDYPNFKGRIGNRKDQQNRLGVYHKIWELMAERHDSKEIK